MENNVPTNQLLSSLLLVIVMDIAVSLIALYLVLKMTKTGSPSLLVWFGFSLLVGIINSLFTGILGGIVPQITSTSNLAIASGMIIDVAILTTIMNRIFHISWKRAFCVFFFWGLLTISIMNLIVPVLSKKLGLF